MAGMQNNIGELKMLVNKPLNYDNIMCMNEKGSCAKTDPEIVMTGGHNQSHMTILTKSDQTKSKSQI